jgi:hypothetical protein
MQHRIGERLAAACGALYVVLLVGGDDFVNPAGEVPETDASLREVTSYLDKADSSGFWLGRSIGLLALCALLVFVVYLSRRIRDDGHALLSGLVLAGGSVAVALQFVAAPAQFAAVQAASDGLDPQVARALLHASIGFQLSFFPLAVVLGAVAAARVLPRWLRIAGGVVAVGLVAGMIGNPEDPAVVSFMAFAFCFLWLIAASVVLVRRAGHRERAPAAAAPVAA